MAFGHEPARRDLPGGEAATAPPSAAAPGKMPTGWLWPVYGDVDEVVFHYAPSRAHRHVHAFLGEYRGTLLSDGYEAYAAYAAYAGQRPGEVTHALCWSHTRRGFERANDSEPEAVAEALAMIGTMYGHEKQIRADGLAGDDKRAYRQTHTRPVVETFWRWCRTQCHRTKLLPKSPLVKALNYALERRSGLEVFLDAPEVAIDTNHLEPQAGVACVPGDGPAPAATYEKVATDAEETDPGSPGPTERGLADGLHERSHVPRATVPHAQHSQ